MAIRKQHALQTASPEDSNQQFLEMLIDHEVQTLIFDPDSDTQWIEYFRSQPSWKVTFDDAQIVSFELDNSI